MNVLISLNVANVLGTFEQTYEKSPVPPPAFAQSAPGAKSFGSNCKDPGDSRFERFPGNGREFVSPAISSNIVEGFAMALRIVCGVAATEVRWLC
jgi:hypothetical protein